MNKKTPDDNNSSNSSQAKGERKELSKEAMERIIDQVAEAQRNGWPGFTDDIVDDFRELVPQISELFSEEPCIIPEEDDESITVWGHEPEEVYLEVFGDYITFQIMTALDSVTDRHRFTEAERYDEIRDLQAKDEVVNQKAGYPVSLKWTRQTPDEAIEQIASIINEAIQVCKSR